MLSMPVGSPAPQPPNTGAPAFGASVTSSNITGTSTTHNVGHDTVKFGKKKDKIKKKPAKHLSSSVQTTSEKLGTVDTSYTNVQSGIDSAIEKATALKGDMGTANRDQVRASLDVILEKLNLAKGSNASLKAALDEAKTGAETSSKATKYVKKELKDGANEFKKKKMGFFSRLIWFPFKMLAGIAGFFKGGRKTMVNILASKG